MAPFVCLNRQAQTGISRLQWLHCVFLFIILLICPRLAGAIGDTATNQSVKYLATGGILNANRDIDALFFNPAGLAFWQTDGLYYSIANQAFFQTKNIQNNDKNSSAFGTSYQGQVNNFLFPTLALVWRYQKLALFLHAGPYGGGATATFEDGIASTASMGVDLEIKVNPAILGFTVGTAYALGQKLALALGGKYFFNSTTVQLQNELGFFQSESSGQGFGAIAGFDYQLAPSWNITAQFQWNSPLEVTNHTQKQQGIIGVLGEIYFPPGAKSPAQLPMLITTGIARQLPGRVKIELDGLLYLQKYNDLGTIDNIESPLYGQKYVDYFQNGFEAGLGGEWELPEKRGQLSLGYLYGRDGQTQPITDEFSYYPNYHQIGVGGLIHLNEKLDLTLGYLLAILVKGKKSFDEKQEFNDGPIQFIGIGCKGKWF